MADKDDTPPDNEGQTPDERLVAMLGLMADDEQPYGPTPSLKEIQDWHLGKLGAERSAQVKTHVARDPKCYQLWRELVEAEQQTHAETLAALQPGLLHRVAKRINAWWQHPPTLWAGGGVATAFVIVLVVIIGPLTQGPWSPTDDPIFAEGLEYNWPYAAMSVTRSGELSYRHKIALQKGLRNGLVLTTQEQPPWAAAIEQLPSAAQPCNDAPSTVQCEKQTKLLIKTGTHAAVLYLACLEFEAGQQTYFDEMFWQQQTEAWIPLATQLAQAQIKPIATLAEKMGQDVDKHLQCDVVRDLIYATY